MACKIAENSPLRRLRTDLGYDPICHSFRADCIHRLAQPKPEYNLGGPGAAIGYCQALFNNEESPGKNTLRVSKLLEEIKAPWHKSHELFWGYRGETAISDYVIEASKPLIGDGRVPILITGLKVKKNQKEIEKILASKSYVVPGETILLRIIIDDLEAVKTALYYMETLIEQAKKKGHMPHWWPLLQGAFSPSEWIKIKSLAGNMWKYFNIAVNPFVERSAFDVIKSQVTVAQVPIGLAEGVQKDSGVIRMAPGMMQLTGAPARNAEYNLFSYFEMVKELEYAPILLVLGPTLPEWSDEINQARLKALIPLLDKGCRNLWHGLSEKNYKMVWNFAA